MEGDKMFVVSHRGWDGTRVLGVFLTREAAEASIKSFQYDKTTEELIFDIVEPGKISSSCKSFFLRDVVITERHHRYEKNRGTKSD